MRAHIGLTLIGSLLVILGAAGPAPAQVNEMLLTGKPPSPGADVPSAPADTYSRPFLWFDLDDDPVQPAGPSVAVRTPWIGKPVVDRNGRRVGEIRDVLSRNGVVDKVILRRSDGRLETVSVSELRVGGAMIP